MKRFNEGIAARNTARLSYLLNSKLEPASDSELEPASDAYGIGNSAKPTAMFGSPGWIRTSDHSINSRMLYR
jgi:hypothetical protein